MQATPEPAPDPVDYFSDRVDQAGARFRQVAAAAGAAGRVRVHPKTGPRGKALSAMAAHLKPETPRALVVVSGTHGLGGECGSDIRRALPEQLAERLQGAT